MKRSGLILFDHPLQQCQLASQMIEELLHSYRELRCYLTARLRNAEDAADIAQSSFERVYAHAMPATGVDVTIESPRALLFRTASNICIDIARHKKVADAWARERMAIATETNNLSTQDHAEHRQMLVKIILLLEQLPQRQREVFVLFKVYGYSREEIARKLNITEATVAKHVVRATVRCAKVFSEIQQLAEYMPSQTYAMPVAMRTNASPSA